jgi:hypothetical protein
MDAGNDSQTEGHRVLATTVLKPGVLPEGRLTVTDVIANFPSALKAVS